MSIIDSQFAALLLLLLLLLFLLLQGWPPSILCRSTPIDSLVGSVDSARRVHWGGAKTLGYVHHWLSIHCSSCSSSSRGCTSCSSKSDLFRCYANQLWLAGLYARSIRLGEYIKTLERHWGTSTIDSQFADLLLLLLDSAGRVHHDGATMLGYVQSRLRIRCSTRFPGSAPHCGGKIHCSPPLVLNLAEDWAMGAYRDRGVTERDWAPGSIYSGDPRVDSHHLILSSYNENYTHCLSQLLLRSALSEIS